jgi:hypothetical protein
LKKSAGFFFIKIQAKKDVISFCSQQSRTRTGAGRNHKH